MMNRDRAEFYNRDSLIMVVDTSIVPIVGSKINIKGKTWYVDFVSYSVDYSDDDTRRQMRANIELIETVK